MVALWIWIAFAAALLAVLFVDLLVFHRRAATVRVRDAALWSALWLVLPVVFAGVLWWWRGGAASTEFLTGYLVERSLSIDNVFVLAVIFAYFGVPHAYRHRALVWGVVGALALRGAFIAAGAAALDAVAWMVYVLGAFLVVTGLRLAVREVEARPDRNMVLRLLKRIVPMSPRFHGQRFLVRVDRRLLATPMLGVLIVIASTDVAFATDSVPAIFGVTDDAFLVFAANAFSVLGMLALYFLLSGILGRFRYLRHGLAAVLVFVGIKMSLADVYEPPPALSLVVVVSIVLAAVAVSLVHERRERRLVAVRPDQGVIHMFNGFHQAIVGYEGSPESDGALDLARRMLATDGVLTAVTVCEERLAVHAGPAASGVAAGMHAAALDAQSRAAQRLDGAQAAETRLVHGRPTQMLLALGAELEVDLFAVGSHGHGRAGSIVLGSVASELLHHAPESVLVVPRLPRPALTRVVVGVDGSRASLGALAVARRLATRAGARLDVVAAGGGKDFDAAVLGDVPGLECRSGRPVDVLVAAAEEADLVVVGSRGLHGLAALGSISERVAHRAPCSVLVVRGKVLDGVGAWRPADAEEVAA